MVAENIKNVKIRIENACKRCGRIPDDIQIVAVSKMIPVGPMLEALEAGQADFGENYVQELQEKQKALAGRPIRWHMTGHLQSNKVKYIADYIHLIHSVDSVDLGKEIDKRSERAGKIQDILVEVHTTDEATKYGVKPEDTTALARQLAAFPHLRVCGLMTMGPFSDNPNDSRPSFRQIAELRRRIESEEIDNVRMRHLSMGMTHDFEVAVEEGATLVRIGTAIFGARNTGTNGKERS